MTIYSKRALPLGVLCLILSLIVLGGTTMAASSTLTVSQAVEYALQQNIGMKQAQLAYENAEMSYRKTMAGNPTEVAKANAAIAWEKAQNAYTTAKADIIIGTLDTYLKLQNARFDIDIKEKQAAAALKNLEKTRVYVQKGTLSSLDELQAELDHLKAVNALDRARDSFAASSSAFAHYLGIADLPEVSTNDLLIIPPFDITLADALQTVTDSSISLKEKRVALDLAHIQRAQDQLSELAPIDEQKSVNDLSAAELAYAKARYDLEESVTSAFNSVIQANKSMFIAQSSYDIETKRFAIVRKQFDAGLKTASELDNGEVALLIAQNALRSAQASYVLTWLEFQKTLGYEISLNGVVKPDAK